MYNAENAYAQIGAGCYEQTRPKGNYYCYNPNRDADDFHDAVLNSCLFSAALLLEKGVNVNAKDRNGRSALHYAVRNGSLENVIWLVRQDADVNAKDDRNETPLFGADIRRCR